LLTETRDSVDESTKYQIVQPHDNEDEIHSLASSISQEKNEASSPAGSLSFDKQEYDVATPDHSMASSQDD